MSVRILVVDDSVTTRKLVSAALSSEGYEVLEAKSGEEALQLVEESAPDLAILDVVMPGIDGYELCRRLRNNEATERIPIMMLTSLDELDEKLKAFEVGADDFLPKPFEPAELRAHVKVLLRRVLTSFVRSGDDVHGKIIAIHSLRGGIGSSTLAVNLAAALYQLWRMPVVLVDLSLWNGQAAVMLNLSIRNSWSDFVDIPAEQIDATMLDQVLLSHDSGLRVLAAPPTPEVAELLSADVVQKVLSLLTEQYAYVVVDLPHDFQDTTLSVLDKAQNILLPLAPELVSVRAAATCLNVYRQLGYSKDAVHLVLNWTFERRGVPRKDIERALKRNISLVFPFVKDELVSALTLGKPPVLYSPNSAITSLFEDVAYFLSKDEHKQNPPDVKTPSLLGVMERMEARRRKRVRV